MKVQQKESQSKTQNIARQLKTQISLIFFHSKEKFHKVICKSYRKQDDRNSSLLSLYLKIIIMTSPMASSLLSEHSRSFTRSTPVYLVIYNFWPKFNKCCECLNLGVYHTGIQIFGDQYMFMGFKGDDTGVFFIEPTTAAYEFYQKVQLGQIQESYIEIDQKLLDPLREQYTGNKYDLLNNNCNHFAKNFADKLQVGSKFPYDKIFKLTDCLNSMRCCIPSCILNGRLDWFYDQPTDNSYSSLIEEIDRSQQLEDQKQKEKKQPSHQGKTEKQIDRPEIK